MGILNLSVGTRVNAVLSSWFFDRVNSGKDFYDGIVGALFSFGLGSYHGWRLTECMALVCRGDGSRSGRGMVRQAEWC